MNVNNDLNHLKVYKRNATFKTKFYSKFCIIYNQELRKLKIFLVNIYILILYKLISLWDIQNINVTLINPI